MNAYVPQKDPLIIHDDAFVPLPLQTDLPWLLYWHSSPSHSSSSERSWLPSHPQRRDLPGNPRVRKYGKKSGPGCMTRCRIFPDPILLLFVRAIMCQYSFL